MCVFSASDYLLKYEHSQRFREQDEGDRTLADWLGLQDPNKRQGHPGKTVNELF